MSTPQPTPDLQFERAEFATPQAAAACIGCHQPIADAYFELNGKLLCPGCKLAFDQSQRGGSAVQRVVASAALALLAGLLSAGIWFGVVVLTGYELGLIAIVVGLLVGGAVRMGSGRRGGWFYQLLAMAITYCSIGVSQTAIMFKEVIQHPERVHAAQANAASQPASSLAGDTGNATGANPGSVDEDGSPASVGAALFGALIYLSFLALSLPILIGQQAPIEFFLVAIALYEAWKMNQRVRLVMTGPHRLASATPPPAPPAGL